MSQFVKDIQSAHVDPIQPRFVDFQRDLTFGKTKKNISLIYVQNTENGRFQLQFRYEFGEESDLRYNYAADYLDYLGTDKLTNEQIKQQFYKLACNYSINVGSPQHQRDAQRTEREYASGSGPSGEPAPERQGRPARPGSSTSNWKRKPRATPSSTSRPTSAPRAVWHLRKV